MTENKKYGKREAAVKKASLGTYWRQHKAWVAGLSRGQKIKYRLFQALVVLAVLVIAVFLAARAWIRLPEVPDLPTQGGVTTQDGEEMEYDGAELPNVAKSGRKDGYYTFLVAGQDVISGSTDTMILISYDTKNKEIHAISLLRDTMINTSSSSKRLNSVYARNKGSKDLPDRQRVENGMNALRQEVSKLTGIYPDFYVMIQWEAVGELVDAIGGVYFEVPFDMDYDDPAQDLHIHQKAGYRLLNGEDAMEVVRFRKNNDLSISLGDSGRTEIQRKFLTAVLKECIQPDVLLKLPTLANIFTENVTTDLSVGNILAFAQLAIGIDPDTDVTMESIPWTGVSYHGASMVLPIQDELLALLNNGINPYMDDIQASDLQLLYQKSDGSFGVTNGTLADPSMGRAYVATKPAQEETEEPEVPIETENPDQSGATNEGGTNPNDPVISGDPTAPGETGEGGTTGEGGAPTEGETSGGTELPGGTDTPSGSETSGGAGTSVDPVIPGDPGIPGDGTGETNPAVSGNVNSSGTGAVPETSGASAGEEINMSTGDPSQVFPDLNSEPAQDLPQV